MKLELINCPGSLKENFNAYSPVVLKKMFNGKKVSPFLNYTSPTDRKDKSSFNQNQTHISISGFQEKYSLILDGKELRLTQKGLGRQGCGRGTIIVDGEVLCRTIRRRGHAFLIYQKIVNLHQRMNI